ncbi:MAG: metallophosphoesterase [Deltaproteobacteria bacterium]|nr:metallophosphoesterase [Deltaproteobacteria bacterium]
MTIRRISTYLRVSLLGLILLLLVLFTGTAAAGNPHSAYYSDQNDRLFWFIVAADCHIGAVEGDGSSRLQWLLTTARNTIEPSFVINAGDLTDSTNWNVLGLPYFGPHQTEWDEYRTICDAAGANASWYFDIPGNHDAYNDSTFAYYRNHSVQGRATDQMQHSWTRVFPYGAYHFLALNTAGNDGSNFTLLPPDYGDDAGLDSTELTFVENELLAHQTEDLTMIFGHHPIVKQADSVWQEWAETSIGYGGDELVSLMNANGASLYGYGHTHLYSEKFYTREMTEGVIYLNMASLGTSDYNHYALIAVDCNGISIKPASYGAWPVVMITTPLDRNLGMRNNPYTTSIPKTSLENPVRALVFDINPVTAVSYRIDQQGAWLPMTQVPGNQHLWEAHSGVDLNGENHTIEVRATGSSTVTDIVPTASPEEPVSDSATLSCFIEASAFDAGRPPQTMMLIFVAGLLAAVIGLNRKREE